MKAKAEQEAAKLLAATGWRVGDRVKILIKHKKIVAKGDVGTVVGPGTAAAPVRRPVGGGAALALRGLGGLGLGGPLGAEALSFRSVPGDLSGAALLVLATCVQITQ